MSTIASTFSTYIGVHHQAPQTKVAGGLLGLAVVEMACRTIVNLGVVLTKGPGHEKHQKNFGINFASTLVWGTMAANIVPGFAILGLGFYSFYSCVFMDNGDGNAYYSARLCRKVMQLTSPLTSRIWQAICALFSSMKHILDHPIGYAGIFVGGAVVLYHGPVIILTKIAEKMGIPQQETT